MYFALKNPVIIQEYNTYHSSHILHTLYAMKEFFPKISKTKKIIFYYPKALKENTQGKYFKARKNYAIYSEKIEIIYIQSFPEQAKGEFLNQATHPKLYKLFEQIRKAILQKCQSSKL
ncbi:hypothetical protein [Helicobacter cholecystus]|uniref:hypothetical protein n=1 Tax=Helicobacter cholecystus TaxID=45498 RepID=UPI0027394F8D|nr:hypothetical protein [Helicobacter cholecystus]